MINLRTLAALAPVGGGVWLVMHPGLASTIVAAGTIGAAVVQHTITKQKAERVERKAAEAAAKDQLAHDREVAEFMAQTAPQSIPQTAQTTLDERIAQMRNRAQVIDYTNASREVSRKV